MKLSIITCCARNNVIGRNNTLPWHLPADLKRFKALTTGHFIVMGRKTYQSLGRPLPNREHIVFSRNGFEDSGCQVVSSIGELARIVGEQRCFVIGGYAIYKLFLPIADEIYHTLVQQDIEGDVYFPISLEDSEEWKLDWIDDHPADKDNPYDLSFRHWVRQRT